MMSLFQDLSRSRLWAWLRENKTWGFSGVGIAVLLALVGWLVTGPTTGGDDTGSAIVGTGIASTGKQIIEGSVTIGYTPEQLRDLMADQRAEHQKLQDKFTALKVQLGVTEQALRGFFDILEQGKVPAKEWLTRLTEIALRHRQALERLAALETKDPQVQALAGQARAAIEAGDYGRAEELLDQAEQRGLAGIQEAEKVLQAAQTTVEQRRLSVAAVRAEQAELSLIQLRYRQAAERFVAAAELVPDSKPEQRLDYRERHADALYRQGDEKGDNAVLKEAIRAYRDLLGAYPRERVPLDWAGTQNNLGLALQTLGERESDTGRLEAAVAAYRAALQEYTRERVPLDWATTQNNLGNALLRLGERESGTGRFEEAVAAFRVALQEFTRERVPLDWAMTQNNLGNALATLGERELGRLRLEEAVAAYRTALQEYTRKRVPLDWAMAQNNLGLALATLGERESGTARLEAAVAAYWAALQEYTRDRLPLD